MEIIVKRNNIGWIVLLLIIILGLIGACIYLYNDKEECKECEKCEECKKCEEVNSDNLFSIFSNGEDKYTKIANNESEWGEYPISTVNVSNGIAYLIFDAETKEGKSLLSKYGNKYSLDLKGIVSSYYVINGTGGETAKSIIFIKNDGTIYAIDNNKLNNSLIEIYKTEYKDIVAVYSSMQAGARITIGVDINGNEQEIILEK